MNCFFSIFSLCSTAIKKINTPSVLKEVGESGELQDIGELFFSQSGKCNIAAALDIQIHPAVRMSRSLLGI